MKTYTDTIRRLIRDKFGNNRKTFCKNCNISPGTLNPVLSGKRTPGYRLHTQLYDSLLDNLSSQKIKEWDIQIQGMHLEGIPEYTMILPNRRKPFQNGGKDDRLSEVQALADRLVSYPALAATQANVAAYASSMQTARDD